MEENRELFLKYMNDIRACIVGDGYPKILNYEHERELSWNIQESIEIVDNDKDFFQFKILDKNRFDKHVKILMNHNLLFVVAEAKSFHARNNMAQLMDLIQEGNMGLYNAALRFDATKGFKYITYAKDWIRAAMYAFINERSRTVVIPVHITNDINKINKVEQKLFAANGFVDPMIVQFGSSFSYRDEKGNVIEVKLADFEVKGTGLHPLEVTKRRKEAARGSSLSDPVSNTDEAETLLDTIPIENDEALKEHRKEASDAVSIAIKRLTGRDKEIMEDLYGINREYEMDIDDVAAKHNLTTVAINYIKKRCLLEMKMSIDKFNNNIDNVDKIIERLHKDKANTAR